RAPGSYGDTRAYVGLVDDLAVYNRALSAAEVQSVYQLGGLSKGGTIIQGNFSGTTPSGGAAVPNGAPGITINASGGNLMGGATAASRNVASGNYGVGIFVTGGAATNNMVAGNFVGTNAAGTAAVANLAQGVIVSGGAHNNFIGTDGNGIGDATEGN